MDTISMTDARKRLEDSDSCFVMLRRKEHIILPPRYIGQVTYGVHQILKAKRGYYCDSLNGVLIAYDGVQFVQSLGTIQDDMPYIHFDIEANFIIFRPVVKQKLIGVINKVSNDHIGCLVHECFNASIPRWGDYGGTDVCQRSGCELGDEITFTVTRVYVQNFVLSMSGRFCELRQKASGVLPDFSSPTVSVCKQTPSKDSRIISDSVDMAEENSSKHLSLTTVDEQTDEGVSENKIEKDLKMVSDFLFPDNMKSGDDMKDAEHRRKKKKKRTRHSGSETLESSSNNETVLLASDALQGTCMKIQIKHEPGVSVNDAVGSTYLSSTTDEQRREGVSETKMNKSLNLVNVNDLMSPDNMKLGNDRNSESDHHKKKKKRKRHSVSEMVDSLSNNVTLSPGSDTLQDRKIEIKHEPGVSVNDAIALEDNSSKHLVLTTDEQTKLCASEKKTKIKLKVVNNVLSLGDMESEKDIDVEMHHHKKKKKRKRHSPSQIFDSSSINQAIMRGSDALQDMKIHVKPDPSDVVNDTLESDYIRKKKERMKKNLDINSSFSEDVPSSSVLQTNDSQSDSVMKKKKRKRKHSDAILSDQDVAKIQIISPPQIKKMKSSDSSETNSIVRKRTQSASFTKMCSEIINEMSDFTQIKIKTEEDSGDGDVTGHKKHKKKRSHHTDNTSVIEASPDGVPINP